MTNIRIIMTTILGATAIAASPQDNSYPDTETSFAPIEHQALTQEWDKTFPKSGKVTHQKVTFINRYGITLVADMYIPKDSDGGKRPAIAVSGPFGAVKEQSSGLYAQQLAERGFMGMKTKRA